MSGKVINVQNFLLGLKGQLFILPVQEHVSRVKAGQKAQCSDLIHYILFLGHS